MVQFFKDVVSFLQSLSTVDFILYFAVLILIILVISLIYLMRTEGTEEVDFMKDKENSDEPINLQEIVNTIVENPQPIIDMTAYETEQEEKAIISYEELLQNSKNYPINYDDEEFVDNEIMVKKVNLEQMTNPIDVAETPKSTFSLFHYEREENFLKTLKELNELLN